MHKRPEEGLTYCRAPSPYTFNRARPGIDTIPPFYGPSERPRSSMEHWDSKDDHLVVIPVDREQWSSPLRHNSGIKTPLFRLLIADFSQIKKHITCTHKCVYTVSFRADSQYPPSPPPPWKKTEEYVSYNFQIYTIKNKILVMVLLCFESALPNSYRHAWGFGGPILIYPGSLWGDNKNNH